MNFWRQIIAVVFLIMGLLCCWQPSLTQAQSSTPSPGRPALYEFGAGYCASCKEMEKILGELKTGHSEQVEFRLIYADKEKDLFQQYKIMLIPTQVFLDAAGKEVDRHVGPLTKEEVLQKLRDLKFIAN